MHYPIEFKGRGDEFAFVVLKNVFLTVLTFGIYAAWAKTNRRRFIWQNTDLYGQRLVYTGTGMEIFLGYLMVAAAYLVFIIGITALQLLVGKEAAFLVQFGFGLLIFLLIPFAIYSSRAYLMRCTRWRGVQLGLSREGRRAYMSEFVIGGVLLIPTLGLYSPVRANRLYGIMMRNSRVGNTPLRYDGSDREAFFLFLKALPLIILTLGIYGFWYQADLMRFRARHTHFDRATATYDVSGGAFFGLFLVNLLLLLITAGLAFPWVVVRNLHFFLGRLSFRGLIDFSLIEQKASVGDALGDSVADALDVDVGL